MSVLDKTNISLVALVRSDDNEEAMYAGRGYIRNLCTLNFDVNLKKLSLKNLQGVVSNARVQTSWFRLILYQTQK